MKILATVLLISSIGIGAAAQETTEPTPKREPGKNEMGLFVEPISSNNFNGSYDSWGGVQFKRWAKPNIAYRIIGAVGDYIGYSNPMYVEKRGDTILQRSYNTNVPMYFLGGGVEVQRQFYKKVVLYAAIEVKAGYGTGRNQELLTKVLESQQGVFVPDMYFEVDNIGTHRVTAFTIDATPFIGAKLNFRRLSLGTEISAINIGLEKMQVENIPSYNGVTNFDVGDLRQRVYLNYRF